MGIKKISEIIGGGRITLSCEMSPPKQWDALEETCGIAKEIAQGRPSFMSVTYGAAGGASEHTIRVADHIQKETGVTALAHLTCVVSGKDKIASVLDDLSARGIRNVLALRGDVPAGEEFPEKGHYEHASDLTRAIKGFGDFCVGGACYPEGHPEAASRDADIEALRKKVDSGCEFLTTQMFFDNDILYNFMFRMLRAKIDVPVIAGIMPVTNAKQIPRIVSLSGAQFPQRFRAIVDRFADNPAAMKQAGIAYATDQIIDLVSNGFKHIHIYTMNKPDIAQRIMANLSDIIVL